MFLLSPIALRYLPTLLLQFIIVGYLLLRPSKSEGSRYLTLGMVSALGTVLSLFLGHSIYAPISAYLYLWGASLPALAGAAFLVQFAYRFPVATYTRESRRALIVSLGMWFFLLFILATEFVEQPSLLVYNFKANLFEHHTYQRFSARSFFDLANSLLLAWILAVLARKTVTLSRQAQEAEADPPATRPWWRHLVHPQGHNAYVARSFILLFLAGIIVMIFSALDSRGLVPPGTLSLAYLLTWTAVILTYANSGTDYVSFVAKLVCIVLITVLALVGLAQAYLFHWQALAADIDRNQEISLLVPRLTGVPLTDLPEPIAYVAARPQADGLFSSNYRFLFNRRADLTPDDLAAADRQMAAALEQGRYDVVLYEFPWLAESGVAPGDWATVSRFPVGARMYRGALDNPADQYLRYALVQGDTLFEIGYRYTDVRLTQHRWGLLMLIIALVSVLVVLLIFPYFLRHVLVQPLDRLLTGVSQMQAGDHLQIDIPVTNRDEIGLLTHAFNRMVASLHILNQGLRQKIEEQTRTQRNLQSSETRFARVVTSVNDHIYLSELDETGLRVNKFISPNVETLTGYPPQSLLDDWYFWHRQITHPDDRAAVQNFSAYLNTGQSAELEYRVVRADGQVIWVRDSAKSEKLADKVIVYGVISDITVRKQAEMERTELLVTTRQAFARLAQAEENERKQLARELHDRIGQNLMALNLNLSTMRTGLLQTEPAPVDDLVTRLADSTQLLKETTQIIRNVLDDLRSPVLDTYGLLAALQRYGRQVSARSGLTIEVDGDAPAPRPAAAIENALFRITQEALTNTLKHAQANRVTITLTARQQRLRLVIVDDGQGFITPETPPKPDGERHGLGLLTIRERAEAVGGVCRIASAPNVGTQVIVEVNL